MGARGGSHGRAGRVDCCVRLCLKGCSGGGYFARLVRFLRFFLPIKRPRFLYSESILSSVTFFPNFFSALSKSPVTSILAMSPWFTLLSKGFVPIPKFVNDIKPRPRSPISVVRHDQKRARNILNARRKRIIADGGPMCVSSMLAELKCLLLTNRLYWLDSRFRGNDKKEAADSCHSAVIRAIRDTRFFGFGCGYAALC